MKGDFPYLITYVATRHVIVEKTEDIVTWKEDRQVFGRFHLDLERPILDFNDLKKVETMIDNATDVSLRGIQVTGFQTVAWAEKP